MTSLAGKTLLVTGGSRGIGLSSYAVNPGLPLAPDFFVEPKKT